MTPTELDTKLRQMKKSPATISNFTKDKKLYEQIAMQITNGEEILYFGLCNVYGHDDKFDGVLKSSMRKALIAVTSRKMIIGEHLVPHPVQMDVMPLSRIDSIETKNKSGDMVIRTMTKSVRLGIWGDVDKFLDIVYSHM